MDRQYNLIDEPWIPVRDSDGLTFVGIRQVLIHGNLYKSLEDPSPLTQIALHLFLLAILYRALQGPKTQFDARQLFTTGIPVEKVNSYLNEWYDRFWLIGGDRPFWQFPNWEPENPKPWFTALPELNDENRPVLWDHHYVGDGTSIDKATAARLLVSVQLTTTTTGNSEFGYRTQAPEASKMWVFPLGGTLQDTLLFSLCPQKFTEQDIPSWEQDLPAIDSLKIKRKKPRKPTGLSDLYSWCSRTITLIPNNDGRISQIGIASGIPYAENPKLRDPHRVYRIDKEGRKTLQYPTTGIWREFASLLPDPKASVAPLAIANAIDVSENTNRVPIATMVVGIDGKQSKVKDWYRDIFTLPSTINNDGMLKANIQEILSVAKLAGDRLKSVVRAYWSDRLFHGKPAKNERIRPYLDNSDILLSYWSQLEPEFNRLLSEYTMDTDADSVLEQWTKIVWKTARTVWDNQLPGDLQSAAKAEVIWSPKPKNPFILEEALNFINLVKAQSQHNNGLKNALIGYLGGTNRKHEIFRHLGNLVADLHPERQDIYLTVAALWALCNNDDPHRVSVGVAAARHTMAGNSVNGVESRLLALCNASPNQLTFPAQNLVQLLRDQPIDFSNMLTGFLMWNDPKSRTQRAWLSDFYRICKKKED